MAKAKNPVFLIILFGMLFFACSENVASPKPLAYPRVDYPKHEYRMYRSEDCGFSFNYPSYAYIERDTTFFGEPAENPCWFNIVYQPFNAKLHCSFKRIEEGQSFEKLVDDSYKLTMKHTRKADYIDQTEFVNEQGVVGLKYNVGGNAATPIQFFVTDDKENFLRAALYFNVAPNIDSLQDVVNFIEKDLDEMTATFTWN